MNWAEFLDKENGTQQAIARLPMSDSARNEYLSGDPGNQDDEQKDDHARTTH